MRACGVLSRSDNCEVHTVMAFSKNPSADVGRYLGFGAADKGNFASLELCGDAIDCCGSSPQCDYLCGVFHGTKRTNDRCCCPEVQIGTCMLKLNKESSPCSFADRGVCRGANEVRNDRDRVVGFAPWANRKEFVSGHHASDFQSRYHQSRVCLSWNDKHCEPFERHCFVARKPRQVGTDRKQADVDSLISHR